MNRWLQIKAETFDKEQSGKQCDERNEYVNGNGWATYWR